MAVHADDNLENARNKCVDSINEKISNCIHQRSARLDLSKTNLSQLPDSIFSLSHVKYIYLRENKIQSLPEEFACSFSQLLWLDLRSNHLKELPQNIFHLKNLKNLLLDDNNIEALPLPLGLLQNLSGLNLSNNPLKFPPKNIIEAGTKKIISYLREQLAIEQRFGNLDTEDVVESVIASETYSDTEDDLKKEQGILYANGDSDNNFITTNKQTNNHLIQGHQINLSYQNIKNFNGKKSTRNAYSHFDLKNNNQESSIDLKSKYTKERKDIAITNEESKNTTEKISMNGKTDSVHNIQSLKENDMVLLKVPTDQYILNQPRIGKVIQLEDEFGFILVHYYTGSFSGKWWPMMSRESRYLREEKSSNVLMKFNLEETGEMTSDVIQKIKELNNGFI